MNESLKNDYKIKPLFWIIGNVKESQNYYLLYPNNYNQRMCSQAFKTVHHHSPVFKILFWGSIAAIVVGTTLSIIYGFYSCPEGYNRHQCRDYFSEFPRDCSNSVQHLCCVVGYKQCVLGFQCIIKPFEKQACEVLLISGISLAIIGVLLLIPVFMWIRMVRKRLESGSYQNLGMASAHENNISLQNQ